MYPYFLFDNSFGILFLFVPLLYLFYQWSQNKIIVGMEKFMADSGIKVNRDIIFNCDKNKLLLDIYNRGNLALGEAYMASLWKTPDLYQFFRKIMSNKNHAQLEYGNGFMKKIVSPFIQNQTTGLAMINNHYNLSNEFFASWLDPNMQYSCAYFNQSGMNLDEAQIAKMNLIGRKLKLEPGMTVLDIGCGWGMLAQYLAKTFNVNVYGINLSTEHLKFANQTNCQPNVKYIFGDFSEISKLGMKFDRVINVGFLEHVCQDRYNELFSVMYDNLKDDGIALVHTIGTKHGYDTLDPWIQKYIFTRGQIPNLCDITVHAENNDFVIEDVHNFGLYYGDTLLLWLDRFEKSNSALKNDPVFCRMWRFYLNSCAAAFHERELFLWQTIFTKKTNKTVYFGVR